MGLKVQSQDGRQRLLSMVCPSWNSLSKGTSPDISNPSQSAPPTVAAKADVASVERETYCGSNLHGDTHCAITCRRYFRARWVAHAFVMLLYLDLFYPASFVDKEAVFDIFCLHLFVAPAIAALFNVVGHVIYDIGNAITFVGHMMIMVLMRTIFWLGVRLWRSVAFITPVVANLFNVARKVTCVMGSTIASIGRKMIVFLMRMILSLGKRICRAVINFILACFFAVLYILICPGPQRLTRPTIPPPPPSRRLLRSKEIAQNIEGALAPDAATAIAMRGKGGFDGHVKVENDYWNLIKLVARPETPGVARLKAEMARMYVMDGNAKSATKLFHAAIER